MSQKITCENKWTPNPWCEGYMVKLSKAYPSVIFHYTTEYEGGERPDSVWFANGDEGNKKDAESSRKQAYKAEVERFVAATASAADGIEHRVEIMPNGRVAADGENRFGECNIFPWTNIKQISCGNWHTVGLKKTAQLLLAEAMPMDNAIYQLSLDELLRCHADAIILQSCSITVR